MRISPRGLLSTIALIAAMAFPLAGGQASADTAGTIHFVRPADSGFDQYTSNPSAEGKEWIRAHIWRMTAWAPYFDSRTSWYSQAWMYDDAYAIYTGSGLASQHPEWILRDASGNKLYIPFSCSGGSCPQYAGDISNPAYRQYWIASAQASLAHGYRGLFIDDVNMEERVGNGAGQAVLPIDSATGQPMSAAAWRGYMAQFMAEIRAAAPNAEIVHNAIWFANSAAGTADPSIRLEIQSADWIYLERGVNDSGLTGGNGSWSVNAFLAYTDEVHALGKNVILGGTSSEAPGMEYNLAAYFMVSDGNDAVSGSRQTPANWWSGWSANLGEATGARYTWANLLRRDFTGGMALLNAPGSATHTVSLPTAMRNTAGATVSSVTLTAGSGAILTSLQPGPIPPPPPPAPAPEPTHTTVETVTVTPAPPAGTPRRVPPAPKKGASGTLTPPKRDPATGSGSGATGSGSSATSGSPSSASHPTRAHRHRRHPVVLARVSGSVRHAPQGHVTILIQVRHGHRWVLARRAVVHVDRQGRFIRMLHLSPARHFRVLALYQGTPRYRPSRSNFRVLVLKRPRGSHGHR